MNWKTAFTGAALLTFAACAAPEESSDLNGDWLVQQIAGAGLNAEQRIYFSIDGDAMRGSTGCNEFNAAVTQFEQSVTISNVSVTERACADEAAQTNEMRFLAVLSSVTRFDRNGASLELLARDPMPDALIRARRDDFAEPAQ